MDPVLQGLRAFASPPPWLTAASDGARVAAALRAHVPELRSEPDRLVACAVEDLRLKGGRWTGRYVLTLQDLDGASRSAAVVGVLAADGARPDSSGTERPIGSSDWRVELVDPPLSMSSAGADRKLAALPMITDPGSARPWLETNLQAAFPGIRISAVEPIVARYRPGQRCTVLCRLSYADQPDPSWPEVVVAKVHRRGEGAPGHGALLALEAAGVDGAGGLAFARPLAYVSAADVSLQGNVPQDRSLIDIVEQAGHGNEASLREAEDALRGVAGALAALHRAPVSYGSVRVLADEIASVRASATKLAAVAPDLPEHVEPLLRLVEDRSAAVAPDPTRPSHGAFRPAQVRLFGDRVGVLDVDGFGQAEPGQDVGRFVGKLRLVILRATGDGDIAASTRLVVGDRLAAAFLERYRDEAGGSDVRAAIWETLDLVKALLQAWSRGRPDQIAPILSLLEHGVLDRIR